MRFKNLFKTKRRKIISGVSALLIILLAAAYALGIFDKEQNKPEDKPVVYHSQLTGQEVSKEESERPILGVMIENSAEARPQTGLDSAGIVFETVTEGGITRYLVLYQENLPEILGPVRSVRPYFVDWVMGFDTAIAHVGGSAPALAMIKQRDAKDLTQFRYTGPYYRDKSRVAPHNMYARTAGLMQLQKELGYGKSEFKEIPRSNDTPSQTPDATKITIVFSRPLFQTEFRYDKASNSYTRYLAGQPHIDKATNKPITVKNVIVLKMPTGSINALGSGEALVFKDGTVKKATWKQQNYTQRIMIVDDSGAEVPMNRGDTWFSAIPGGKSATYN